MGAVYGLLILAGFYPLWRAWRSARGSMARHALAWGFAAWAGWAMALWLRWPALHWLAYDVLLWRAVTDWLADEWPFERVAYAERAHGA